MFMLVTHPLFVALLIFFDPNYSMFGHDPRRPPRSPESPPQLHPFNLLGPSVVRYSLMKVMGIKQKMLWRPMKVKTTCISRSAKKTF